jgi:hypothetical protein
MDVSDCGVVRSRQVITGDLRGDPAAVHGPERVAHRTETDTSLIVLGCQRFVISA